MAVKLDTVRANEEEEIEQLRRSKKLVGELYPIIIGICPEHGEEYIAGHHRKRAGWKSVIRVQCRSHLDLLQRREASTIQRKSSMNEHVERLRELCEEVWRQKLVSSPFQVCKYVVTNLSALPKSYAYDLIDNRWKRQQTKDWAAPPGSSSEFGTESTLEKTGYQEFGETIIVAAGDAETDAVPFRIITCPYCSHDVKLNQKTLEIVE